MPLVTPSPRHQVTPSPTAALLTPRGRGAVATIRFEGDVALIDGAARRLFRAANGKPLARQPIDRIVFGAWGDDPAEEVVVCRIADRMLEIHCHGGDAATRRILDDLASVGGRVETWPEMLRRADGIFAAECAEALAQATTRRTAEILLEQTSGVLRDAVATYLPPPLTKGGPGGVRDTGDLRSAQTPPHPPFVRGGVLALLSWADFGLHLTRPWSVVLAGRPNVGKSSLINALVGYTRSIIYDQPGTTRDVVTAETAFDGWPVRLADTAGIRADAEELEAAGIERARRRLAEADCRVILLDTSRPPHEDDRRLLDEWPGALVVAHKADLPDVWGDAVPVGAVRVSSVTGRGVPELMAELVRRLVPRVPHPGTPVPFTRRQVELLRQALAAEERGDAEGVEDALRALLG